MKALWFAAINPWKHRNHAHYLLRTKTDLIHFTLPADSRLAWLLASSATCNCFSGNSILYFVPLGNCLIKNLFHFFLPLHIIHFSFPIIMRNSLPTVIASSPSCPLLSLRRVLRLMDDEGMGIIPRLRISSKNLG